jgi:hypothetical protein
MQFFRCYALDGSGTIVSADNIEGDDLPTVIEAAWHFVASCAASAGATGLEIWQGTDRLFSTDPAP